MCLQTHISVHLCVSHAQLGMCVCVCFSVCVFGLMHQYLVLKAGDAEVQQVEQAVDLDDRQVGDVALQQ